MPDDRPKPSIPAWQRASKPAVPPAVDPVSSQPSPNEPRDAPPKANVVTESNEDAAAADTSAKQEADQNVERDSSSDSKPTPAAADQPAAADSTPPTAAPTMTTKEIPVTTPNTFSASDFHTYTQQQLTPKQAAPPTQPAPPIITYPEFLVQAHATPPLITPSRIANTVTVAGGIAALVFGARQFLFDPMIEALTDARHDLLTHSHSKIDDVNERLSKLVSKVPDSNKISLPTAADFDDSMSENSDRTELFSRSTGTQTTPNDSTTSSIAGDVPEKKHKNDANAFHVRTLNSLNGHLESMLQDSEHRAAATKESQESITKLRHYLDTLTYPNSAINLWQGDDSPLNTTTKPAAEDPIEDLKKEIRGVKGVLLSAKRFPAAGRSVSSAA